MWASQVALVVKNLPAGAGDAEETGYIPGSGRFPGIVNGNSLQYSCLENSMDRGLWWAASHGVTKSQTRLNDWAYTYTQLWNTFPPYTCFTRVTVISLDNFSWDITLFGKSSLTPQVSVFLLFPQLCILPLAPVLTTLFCNYIFICQCMHVCMLSHFSPIPLFATPWTVACQAPLSMGFPRWEHWSGLPFPSPGNLPNPGIKPGSLCVSCIGRWSPLFVSMSY